MKSNSVPAILGASLAALVAQSGPALAIDVTQLLIAHTDADERIAFGCQRVCQGNRRRSSIDSVDVVRVGPHAFALHAFVSLINQSDGATPAGKAGTPAIGAKIFNERVVIEVFATLEDETCAIRLDRLAVTGDAFGLGKRVKALQGKIYQIKNCGNFLAGL
jgi:hypothetical protein